jgi:hypothetical protein
MSILSQQKQSVNTDFPNIRPSLDLRFALAKKLDPRITFTRGSTGTYFGPDGIMRTADVNEPRFDHDPVTGQSLGLLIEESMQNLVINSGIEGTVGNKPTNFEFASTIVGQSMVVSNDFDLSGNGRCIKHTRGVGGDSNLGYPTGGGSLTIGVTYSFSVYVYIPSSQKNNITSIRFGPDSGFSSVTYGFANLSIVDGWQRVSGFYVASTTSIGFLCRATARYGAFFYTDCWQVEAGAFPTSYIPTTASTVTRSADVASMEGTNFSSWYNQNEGTIYCVYKNNTTDFTTRKNVYSISGNSEIELRSPNISSNRLRFVFNGQFNSNPTQVSASLNQRKTAFSFNQNRHYAYIDSEYVIPSTIHINDNTKNILILGNRIQGATDYLNGTISRLTYYPIALTPTQLINLTS